MSMAKRFRLGVDFHEWDGIFQGSRSHVLGLYRAAIRLSQDIDFVFFLDDTEGLRQSYPEFQFSNVELVRMPTAHGLTRLGVWLPWLTWRHQLDVLHTQYRVPFIRLASSLVTIHDVLFETHPQFFSPGFVREAQFTHRLAAKQAALILTVSQFSKQQICQHYGIAPARVRVTYNGVDRARFYPGADGEDQVAKLGLESGQYLLVVGRLEPRKNHLKLIEAWASLGDAAPTLVIVGQEDRNFPDVKRAIANVANGQKVMVFENLSDALLPAVIRHAKLFVYPAFAEGFGMPVAEAMASGVPVVTSNTTSLPEVAGGGAILFDPNDVSDLSRALKQALNLDESARRALIQAAQAHVEQFDWNDSAKVLLQAISELRR